MKRQLQPIEHDGANSSRKRKKTASHYNNGDHGLPDHLFANHILCKLPLRSLFRCTIVCKGWRNLVLEVHDIYYGGTITNYANLLIDRTYQVESMVSTIRVITPNTNAANAIPTISRQYQSHWDACDGTDGFLLYHSYSMIERPIRKRLYFNVCNPLTSKSIPIPPIHYGRKHPNYRFSMLVFDPAVSRHYKVLSFFTYFMSHQEYESKLYHKVCVFSSQQPHLGWRTLEDGLQAMPKKVDVAPFGEFYSSTTNTMCVNGYAYRIRYLTDSAGYDSTSVVLSFHAKDERFQLIDCPPATNLYPKYCRGLSKAQGCLQYICNISNNVSIWRLQEDGRSWELRYTFLLDSGLNQIYIGGSHALGVDGKDEVFYFISRTRLVLYQYNIKQQKIENCLDSDGNQISGRLAYLHPFSCCAIDPEFRRFVLRSRN